MRACLIVDNYWVEELESIGSFLSFTQFFNH